MKEIVKFVMLIDNQKKKKKLDCQCIDEKSANFGKFSVGTSKSQ